MSGGEDVERFVWRMGDRSMACAVSLAAQVRQPATWPTPQSHDAKPGDAERVGRFGTKHGGRNLNDEVKLWPTPRANDALKRGDFDASDPRNGLAGAARLWPTPTASPNANRTTKRAPSHDAGTHGKTLAAEVRTFPTPKMWLTPSANEDAAGRVTGQMQQMLTHQAKASDPDGTAAGGQLNPDWVELLMGWPLGWTRLDPLDPAVFEAWRAAFLSGEAVVAWQDGTWEAGVPRVAVKTPHRVPRLTGLGNGQVPLVVAVGWATLLGTDRVPEGVPTAGAPGTRSAGSADGMES